MNLFIDTNVFLSFYHLTSEDLEELKKLVALIKKRRVQLLLPTQVIREFDRNRDAKIADALRHLRSQTLNFKFPQLSKEYDKYSDLRDLQRKYEKTHADLLEEIRIDVDARDLAADHLVKTLFGLSKKLDSDPEIVASARLRMDLGNPPGKRGSLGDAINWETLLAADLDSEDLHFVTEDRDYFSPLDPNEFDSFLTREWCERGFIPDLFVYKRLSGFFKSKFPEIRLASEIDKDLLIAQLAASESFSETHSVVAELSQFPEFSAYQVDAVLRAALSNQQVGWIVGDPDITAFLTSAIQGKEDRLDERLLNQVLEQIEGGSESDFED
jgi:predicted nucleic acid-binding protein